MSSVAPIYASENARRTFKPVPEGTHVAICVMVVDLGVQPGGKFDPKHQVWISWEIPDEIIEYERDGEKLSGPARIGRAYTLSLNEKASLRAILESWRGKKFTADELKKFDITTILGAPCMLSVTHKRSEDGERTFANIQAVMHLPKGMKPPETETELLAYSVAQPNDLVFHALPKFLQEKIENRLTESEPKAEAPESEDEEEFNDEIPF